MTLMQLICSAIVTVYLAARIGRAAAPLRVARRLVLLALAGFVGEDTVIRAYGFYHYSPDWAGFVDQVPVLIILIWPIVIDSAWQLARRLLTAGHPWLPVVGGAIVLLDAALIEPIAVNAGLWAWTEPGLFGVPPIGMLGWAFFATAAIALLERREALVVPLAPMVTHAALLASWWLLFRWVNRPLPGWPAAALSWSALGALAVAIWRNPRFSRVPLYELMLRLPGATFFFVLLAARPSWPLVTWALAFVSPYAAVLRYAAAAQGREHGQAPPDAGRVARPRG